MRSGLYSLARPLLFALDPERAHELTLASLGGLAASGALDLAAGPPVDDPVELMGLRFANRVGLAAGMDKDGAHIDALSRMGFGFIEVGTVTPRPQPGNPRPRMFRLPAHRALINRMGFNNAGADAFIANVQRSRYRGTLGLNIGKNADTPIERAIDDYLECLRKVYPHAGYVTINISSPNTRNLRQLQGADELDRMLERLREARDRLATEHRRQVPMMLKIAPDLEATQIDSITAALLRHGMDGVIATNTTVSREMVAGARHAREAGGLSGAPLAGLSNRVIRALRERLPADYPIVGVGGIFGGADARAKIEAGASLVQLFTGLVYQGPAVVGECARALAART
ncbi:MAG: quinone-dependent dihydroorotate dehydrogenase [Burkholderiaceae bacterium]|jgi:dihydroorotate dehydrogenase|nr:quinone-dependent dihydroorotate dehydrogenase [Burkholderiaceae bacterium]MEB2317767.1 quinone-dependent dihydroorotate dehydrogenase [Pseudomonadota bacterium]